VEELLSGNPHLEKESVRSIADGAMMEAASICVGQMVGARSLVSHGTVMVSEVGLGGGHPAWGIAPVPRLLWLEKVLSQTAAFRLFLIFFSVLRARRG